MWGIVSPQQANAVSSSHLPCWEGLWPAATPPQPWAPRQVLAFASRSFFLPCTEGCEQVAGAATFHTVPTPWAGSLLFPYAGAHSRVQHCWSHCPAPRDRQSGHLLGAAPSPNACSPPWAVLQNRRPALCTTRLHSPWPYDARRRLFQPHPARPGQTHGRAASRFGLSPGGGSRGAAEAWFQLRTGVWFGGVVLVSFCFLRRKKCRWFQTQALLRYHRLLPGTAPPLCRTRLRCRGSVTGRPTRWVMVFKQGGFLGHMATVTLDTARGKKTLAAPLLIT